MAMSWQARRPSHLPRPDMTRERPATWLFREQNPATTSNECGQDPRRDIIRPSRQPSPARAMAYSSSATPSSKTTAMARTLAASALPTQPPFSSSDHGRHPRQQQHNLADTEAHLSRRILSRAPRPPTSSQPRLPAPWADTAPGWPPALSAPQRLGQPPRKLRNDRDEAIWKKERPHRPLGRQRRITEFEAPHRAAAEEHRPFCDCGACCEDWPYYDDKWDKWSERDRQSQNMAMVQAAPKPMSKMDAQLQAAMAYMQRRQRAG